MAGHGGKRGGICCKLEQKLQTRGYHDCIGQMKCVVQPSICTKGSKECLCRKGFSNRVLEPKAAEFRSRGYARRNPSFAGFLLTPQNGPCQVSWKQLTLALLRFHTRRLGAAKPHLNQGRLGRALTHEQACQGQHCQPITRRRSACSLISLLLSGGHVVLMQTHCAQNCSAMNHPAILSPVHRSSWQLQCLWAQLQ